MRSSTAQNDKNFFNSSYNTPRTETHFNGYYLVLTWYQRPYKFSWVLRTAINSYGAFMCTAVRCPKTLWIEWTFWLKIGTFLSRVWCSMTMRLAISTTWDCAVWLSLWNLHHHSKNYGNVCVRSKWCIFVEPRRSQCEAMFKSSVATWTLCCYKDSNLKRNANLLWQIRRDVVEILRDYNQLKSARISRD